MRVLALLALTACGRIGFGSLTDDAGAADAADAATDGAPIDVNRGAPLFLTATLDMGAQAPELDLAIGPDKVRHAIWNDNISMRVMYARQTSSWSVPVVIAVADNTASQAVGIAVHSDNTIHTTFDDGAAGSDTVSYSKGPVWTAPAVVRFPARAQSLRVGADGVPRMAYFLFVGSGQLAFSSNAGAGWVEEIIDATANTGRNPRLVIDAAGKSHITYFSNGTTMVHYATNRSGAWVTEPVTPALNQESQIEVTPVGDPVIVAVVAPGQLKLARRIASTWDVKTVVTRTGDEHFDFALASDGVIYLAYDSGNEVRLALIDNGVVIDDFSILGNGTNSHGLEIAVDGTTAYVLVCTTGNAVVEVTVSF